MNASSDDPLQAALDYPEPVLAIITAVEGPSYRPLGEIMSFCGETRVGSLSSGCIEADLALHAQNALEHGPAVVRYGAGSPYLDIQLPCGGGLEITLIPRPDKSLLDSIQREREKRHHVAMSITDNLRFVHAEPGATGQFSGGFRVGIVPPPRFLIFGKGPEAAVFADLVRAANYPHLLLSADEETLAQAMAGGCRTQKLHWPALPAGLEIDDRTAIVLFFHDHGREPPILARALASPAFYIGAQGSMRARDARLEALRKLGVEDDLDRLKGPIGLVRSARDPKTLAVSVLAEVLDAAR